MAWTLAWKDMTLDEIGTEMTEICKQIESGDKTLTKDELKELKNDAGWLIERLQEQHGEWTMVFGPEVPAEVQKMWHTLDEFANAE